MQANKPVLKPVKLSISHHVESFLISQDVAASSQDTYRNALRRFSNWLKKKRINKPKRETILLYKNYLDKQELSTYTKAIYLVVVRRFFVWTEEYHFYPNIAHGIKGIKRRLKRHNKDSLTPDYLKRLFAVIDQSSIRGKRDFALINTLVRTGLRLKELAGATFADLQTKDNNEALLWIRGKGRDGKDDFVVLTEETLRPLAIYLKARNIRHDRVPLFASLSDRNYGKKITINSLSRIIKDYLRKAGLDKKRISAHSLRHTFGVLAMKAGASLYDVQLAMRHTAPSTTQLYLGDIEHLKRLEASPERKISALLDSLGI